MRQIKRRKRTFEKYEDEDPLSSVANLFDVAMIFSIGFLIFALTHFGLAEMLTQEKVTIVKYTMDENMEEKVEIIIKEGEKIEIHNTTKEVVTTSGTKLGTIYETSSGGWVLVDEKPKD